MTDAERIAELEAKLAGAERERDAILDRYNRSFSAQERAAAESREKALREMLARAERPHARECRSNTVPDLNPGCSCSCGVRAALDAGKEPTR